MWNFSQMMDWFSEDHEIRSFLYGDWGIEREAQRVTETGDLALTDHPAAFGNKLTNPNFTTDFAESQIEMITPPLCSIEDVYATLVELHDEAERVLDNEYLWPFSMPPRLPEEKLIRIAQYDDSPEGKASYAYREGLAERYGKKMQMISGLHVNFSFKPVLLTRISELCGEKGQRHCWDKIYFAMSRNFLRYRWLLIYLFGASPVVDHSYDTVVSEELDMIEQCSPTCSPTAGHYEQFVTSLRVSRYGYSNTNQQNISVSFDSLDAHVASIQKMLKTMIQNERELYSPIRLKPHLKKGEGYLNALKKGGVRYAEIRLMDLNPFVREGVSLRELRMLHVFIIFCLFEQSPMISEEEDMIILENHHKVSLFGRKPNLQLEHHEQGTIAMTTWAKDIFEKLRQVATILDGNNNEKLYIQAVEKEFAKINDSQLIPSARIIHDMKQHQMDFIDYGVHLIKMIKGKAEARC